MNNITIIMNLCLLCNQEFTEKRGLNEHYHKKQSCIPQKKILDLYKSLHKLIEYKIDYTNNDNKDKIDLIFDNIKSIVSNVELNPIYSKLNEFGKENMELIELDKSKIEKSLDNGLLVYIKTLYCNNKYLDNRNIKVT